MSAAAPTATTTPYEAPVVDQRQAARDRDQDVRDVRERLREARSDRKRYEPTWLSNLAFAAGKHWLVWHPNSQSLRMIDELDPRWEDRELFTADIITEQRAAALGELQSDDDRPELLLAQPGEEAEELQGFINRAIEHGWDYEWRGDDAIIDVRRKVLDFGVSALRCRFDPTQGPVRQGSVPHQGGKPVLDLEQAHKLMENGPRPDVQMREIHEGRITWEPLSPFALLVPPGIVHERSFPWEGVVAPVLLDTVQEEYGAAAQGMTEDGDIGSILGLGAKEVDSPSGNGDGSRSRLRGHVWLYTYYERPTRNYPKGRKIVLGGSDMRLLDYQEELPYKAPDGSYRSGIHYFHWWRLNDRFWSRSFVETLKDPQRLLNRRQTQKNEIIDRSMPFVLVEEGHDPPERTGAPMEIISIKTAGGEPKVVSPLTSTDHFDRDMEVLREHAAHASTLSALRLGENPQNVQTYSQLALLNENESQKRQHIVEEHKEAIRGAVEDSVYDIRTYWGDEKKILVGGPEDRLQAHTFMSSKVPDFYVVRVAKGAAKPRTQGAELKKIDDIWQAVVATSSPVSPKWLQDSYEAGEALPLPDIPSDIHLDKAHYENELMAQGKDIPVAYYDPHTVHIPIHREGQVRAELSGDMETWRREETHIQEHLAAAQANAEQNAQMLAPGGPNAPAAPALPGGPATADAGGSASAASASPGSPTAPAGPVATPQ
jgi:hypothetical protein